MTILHAKVDYPHLWFSRDRRETPSGSILRTNYFTLEGFAMKRMLIGIATVTSLLATSAFAADLPARTYTKAPVYVEPVFNWTGFYVGGNIGYSWGRS
ncbi:MAG: hypothetical protein WCC91_08930, partial [Bradyrhizobium sp.]